MPNLEVNGADFTKDEKCSQNTILFKDIKESCLLKNIYCIVFLIFNFLLKEKAFFCILFRNINCILAFEKWARIIMGV